MRFLWQSNAPWVGTGYGVQTRLILKALKALEHDPTCFCFYGLSGGTVTYDGYECLPGSGFDEWGNDVIQAHVRKTKAQAVITLQDLFVLSPDIWAKLDVPWVAWVPVDSFTVGEMTLDRLRLVNYPVAMSNWGAMQMMDSGIAPEAIIYHAVDTDVFRPMDKLECRRALGIPEDMYLVGMVMANKGNRKRIDSQMLAVQQWADATETVDNVRVYIHTEPTAQMGGYDIRSLVKKIGLDGRVFSTNQYDVSVVPMSPDAMAKVYNSFDVLMNCSSGEGFGVPIIEAQACGVPVITQNFTSMPEITINGYTVETHHPDLGLHGGWMSIPSIEDMKYRLECVARMASQEKAMLGRHWVVEHCSIPVIAHQWDDLLRRVKEDSYVDTKTRRMVLT